MRFRSVRALTLGAAFFVTASVGAALSGCSRTPDEPVNQRTTAVSEVVTLKYAPPPSWTKTESSETGARRAGFKVPHVGDDKEDAEALVLFFGTGSGGERDKIWDEWFGQFDGEAKKDAKRSTFDVKGMQAESFEFLGTYKLNMGPHKPGQTKSLVQMVKKDNRMIAVVLHTKDRGNWFFRLVGPDATVQSASSDFRTMIESAE